MNRTLIHCCLLLCLLAPLSGRSQTTGFVHYGREEGLPASEVTTLVQGPGGRLWMGTIAGLSCYDGTQLTTYPKLHGFGARLDFGLHGRCARQRVVWPY